MEYVTSSKASGLSRVWCEQVEVWVKVGKARSSDVLQMKGNPA